MASSGTGDKGQDVGAAVGAVPPSPWVERFARFVVPGGPVLDVACGGGRHSRLFRRLGHPVTAVDRDVSRLAPEPGLEIIEADLERGAPLPTGKRQFHGVVVTNYLHRPLLVPLVEAVAAEGLLLYETFALGNERFGRPSNPDFLLRPGELLELARGRLRVLAYEDLVVDHPKPAAVQRIAARREVV